MATTDVRLQALRRLPLGYRMGAVRRARGQTQEALAKALSDRAGRKVGQSQISQLERLQLLEPSPPVLAVVEEYCEDLSGLELVAIQAAIAELPAVEALPALPDQSAAEPLLGPRQADLLEALRIRLRDGPPLSEFDLQAFRDTGKMLGLKHF